MPTPQGGSRNHLQKLREKLQETHRLVSTGKEILSQIDQEFASLKDRRAELRRKKLLERAEAAPRLSGKATKGRRGILLIEDHPIVRRGMAELINYEPDVQIVGTAEDFSSAFDQVSSLEPDLVIMDLSLKERSGLELLKDIKHRFPQQRVLILSLHDEAIYAPRALRAGACGYVMKEAATETLLEAIRQVLAGGIYLSPAMRETETEAASLPLPERHPLEVLTDRELDVLRLIGYGRTSREIAGMLTVNVKTIESHRTHIRNKLKLKNGTGLVQLAIELHQNPRHLTPPPA